MALEDAQGNDSCNCNCSCGKTRKVFMVLGMLLLAGVVVISLLRDRIVYREDNQVSVSGQGKVSYQADMAVITLGTQVDKVDTSENALRQLNDVMNRVVPAVKALGIVEKDIQTQSYSLYAQYDYIDNVSNVSGYNANQQIVITARGIDQNKDLVSKVVAEAAKAGANQVNSIVFSTSKLDELKQQARLKAISDARQKSGAMAQAAGVRLGKIASWYENTVQSPDISTGSYYGGYGAGGEGAGSPQVPVGSQDIIIEVNVSYHIK